MTRTLNGLAVGFAGRARLAAQPIALPAGRAAGLVAGLTALWDRYALAEVTYTRRIATPRLFVGEETDLSVEIVNAKPLPLAWLKAEDEWPAEITLERGRLSYSWKPDRRVLFNMISLRFYERVRKQYQPAGRPAVARWSSAPSRCGRATCSASSRQEELAEPDVLIVYPKVVPVAASGSAAPRTLLATPEALRRIAEDPLRIVGRAALSSR